MPEATSPIVPLRPANAAERRSKKTPVSQPELPGPSKGFQLFPRSSVVNAPEGNMAEGRDGPLTVTHGDYRLDNLMFASNKIGDTMTAAMTPANSAGYTA